MINAICRGITLSFGVLGIAEVAKFLPDERTPPTWMLVEISFGCLIFITVALVKEK